MWGYQRASTHLALCSRGWLWTTLRWLRIFFLFLLFFLVLFLFASLDSVTSRLDPIHDSPNRHGVLARMISTCRNTLLNHGKDVLTGGQVSSIVSPFRRLSRGPIESCDT